MASLDGVLTRQALAQTTGISVGSDTPVALRIRNTAGLAVTSIDVDNGSELITLTDSSGAPTVDMNGKTIGQVADAINALANWECLVLDCLRSDSCDDKLVDETISTPTVVNGVSVFDTHIDTSVTKSLTVRCTFNRVPNQEIDVTDRRVRINEIAYNATLGSGGQSAGLLVYEVKGSTETLVVSKTSVSASTTQLYILNGATWLDGAFGADLVVRLVDATSITDAAANFVQVNFRKE
jgi:hypothetical protein